MQVLARVALLLSVCALVTCVAGSGLCPCGADPSQPLAQHDLSFIGDHLVDNQCVCRCGSDTPEGRPKDESGDCSDDGQACTDSNGAAWTLDCY